MKKLLIVAFVLLAFGCGGTDSGGDEDGTGAGNNDPGTAPLIMSAYFYTYPENEMTFLLNPGDQYVCDVYIYDPDEDITQLEMSIHTGGVGYSGPDMTVLPTQEFTNQHYITDPMTAGDAAIYTHYFTAIDLQGNESDEFPTLITVMDP